MLPSFREKREGVEVRCAVPKATLYPHTIYIHELISFSAGRMLPTEPFSGKAQRLLPFSLSLTLTFQASVLYDPVEHIIVFCIMRKCTRTHVLYVGTLLLLDMNGNTPRRELL